MVKLFYLKGKMILFISLNLIFVCLIVKRYLYMQDIWFWYLSQFDTMKDQSSLCRFAGAIPAPIHK